MKVNWLVRFKNKAFWVFMIPAILLLVQSVSNVFGYTLNFGELETKLLAVVEAVFSILTFLGIVLDPTTDGLRDSDQAMTYTEPKRGLSNGSKRY